MHYFTKAPLRRSNILKYFKRYSTQILYVTPRLLQKSVSEFFFFLFFFNFYVTLLQHQSYKLVAENIIIQQTWI